MKYINCLLVDFSSYFGNKSDLPPENWSKSNISFWPIIEAGQVETKGLPDFYKIGRPANQTSHIRRTCSIR